MVVVDRVSKYVHFLALKHPYTAQTVAQVFLDNIVKQHGFPEVINSDRDIVFLSIFFCRRFLHYKVCNSTCPQLTTLSQMAKQRW